MTDIGATLKAAREEKELTIEDAVAVTRIRAHFLEALERNDFDALGGDLYVRGFLRNYAKFLGLELEPLLAPVGGGEQLPPMPERSTQPTYLAEPLVSNPFPIGRILFMLIGLLLLGGLGAFVWSQPEPRNALLEQADFFNNLMANSPAATVTAIPLPTVEETPIEVASEEETEEESPEEAEAPEETETPTTDVTEVAEVPTEEATNSPIEPSPTVEKTEPTATAEPTATEEIATPVPTATLPPRTPTNTPPPTDTPIPTETPEPTATTQPTAAPDSEGVVLIAQILSDTWVRVFVDDESEPTIERTAKAGESYEWVGAESVLLRAGNAAGISVILNGEEIGILGNPGEIVERLWRRNPDGGPPVLEGGGN